MVSQVMPLHMSMLTLVIENNKPKLAKISIGEIIYLAFLKARYLALYVTTSALVTYLCSLAALAK